MKFSIGTVSSDLELVEDLKLIKSSLLYADEIELIGMAEYAIFRYLPNCIKSVSDIESFTDAFIPLMKALDVEGTSGIVEELESLKEKYIPHKEKIKKKKCRSKQEILAQLEIGRAFKQFKNTLEEDLTDITGTESAMEITKLIDRGIVSIFDYDCKEFDIDALAGGYFASLIGAMQNYTGYPLFDRTSNEIIASIAKTKILDLGNVKREVLNHAGVAANILMTLPTLEKAPVDEILDFKKEMSGALINFRSAIYSFAEKVEAHPWDKDFQYDCLKLYSTEVVPRVEELNVLSSEMEVLKNMGRKVLADEEIRKSLSWMAGGLVTTITTSSNMVGAFDSIRNMILSASMVVVAPNAVSLFLKTLNNLAETKQELGEIKKEMTGNAMFYYYKALTDL